jgi:hypothetical protein
VLGNVEKAQLVHEVAQGQAREAHHQIGVVCARLCVNTVWG